MLRRFRPINSAAATALMGATLLIGAGCAPAASTRQRAGGDEGLSARSFTSPPRSSAAMFRWWWPSSVKAGPAVRQLDQIADAGYRGVEIAFVMDGSNYVVDPDRYAYGGREWRRAVKAVLAEANARGLQVDLTLGGRWPAAVPGLAVGSAASSKELVVGNTTLAGGATFDGPVPRPAPFIYSDRTSTNGVITTILRTATPTLVTATATRCTAACDTASPTLDLSSVRGLDARTTDDRVTWTAPAAGTWILSGYWSRGTAQRNDPPYDTTASLLSDPESRVVDHFSDAGAAAIIDDFRSLLDDETRALLRRNGGSLFDDSLELAGSRLWTEDFLSAFKRTNGYSLRPYLPVIVNQKPAGLFDPPTPGFTFAGLGAPTAQRVLADVEKTYNDLYLDHHLRPLQEWAHSLGLTFRAQAYGAPIDLAEAAGRLDRAECESLSCSEQQRRTAAAGVALARKRHLSNELLPGGFGNLYGLTPAQIAALANHEYALGANTVIFHGFDYPYVPPSANGTIIDDASHWPGQHAFPSEIGESFGPRQPSWTMERDISGYYARTQRVLQAGTQQFDVAVLDAALSPAPPTFDATVLSAAGYTYGVVTPGSLDGLEVHGGLLDPDGAAFGALVIDETAIDLPTLRTILGYAEQGLRIVLVGDVPSRTRGYAATAADAAAADLEVRRLVDRLLDSGAATRVATDGGVPASLAGVRVRPAAVLGDPAIQAVHRRAPGVDVYFLTNTGSAPVDTTATVPSARGTVPYRLDAWSGAVRRIDVAPRGSSVRVAVSLPAGDSAIIALAGRSWGEGRTTSVEDPPTGAPITLDRWKLDLDEWLPGSPRDASDLTRHVHRQFTDLAPGPWSALPEITDAVGVGTYTTQVTIPEPGRGTSGPARRARFNALLDLGAVGGAYEVFVNGERIPTPDQIGTRVELGPALHSGPNKLLVRVASPLLNRLRITRPAEFGDRAKTANGLLGPVTLRYAPQGH